MVYFLNFLEVLFSIFLESYDKNSCYYYYYYYDYGLSALLPRNLSAE